MTPADPFEARVRIELLRTLVRLQRGLLLGMPITAAAVTAVNLLWTSYGVAFAWYLALMTSMAIAFFSNAGLDRADPPPEDAGRWTLRIVAGELPLFLVWPAMVAVVWVDGNPGNNVYLCVFMLASLTTGTVIFGPFLPAALLHNGIILPFTLAYAVTYDSSMPWLGPAVQFLFGVVMCGLAVNVSREARASAEHHVRNKALVLQLAAERDRADQANHAKSAFLASMSHDLRTPLNGVIGYADLIRRETHGPVNPPKYAAYIDNIRLSGQHLLALINEVLDLAKIEAGKRELDKQELHVAGAANEAVRFVETLAEKAKVTLRVAVEPNCTLIADKRAMVQIMTNLLSNAIKFTKPDGMVTVFARRTDGAVLVGVEDTGTGMTPEGLKKAVEPFGQAEVMTTVEGRGTGLGLPIVKALIEAHGATFRIESAYGVGTRVWGEFPDARASQTEAA